jgi:hypothetical protein
MQQLRKAVLGPSSFNTPRIYASDAIAWPQPRISMHKCAREKMERFNDLYRYIVQGNFSYSTVRYFVSTML